MKENEFEKAAYEMIGRIVVDELNKNRNSQFVKEFNKRKIGRRVDLIVKNYIIDAEIEEKTEKKTNFFKRITNTFRDFFNRDTNEIIVHG